MSLERTIRTTRRVVTMLVAGVLAMAVLAAFLRFPAVGAWMVAPAALFGAVSPVLGYRLYVARRERAEDEASVEARHGAFTRATLMSLMITEVAALVGLTVWVVARDPFALIGVVTHLLLAGAIWPSEARLRAFLEAPG